MKRLALLLLLTTNLLAAEGKWTPQQVLELDPKWLAQQGLKLPPSRLWDPQTQVARSALPSVGRILSDLTAGTFDGAAYDRDLPARVAGSLY